MFKQPVSALRIATISALVIGQLGISAPASVAKEANAVGSSKITQQTDGSSITCTVEASDGGRVKCVKKDANGNTTSTTTHHPQG